MITPPDGWNLKPLLDCTSDGNLSYGVVQPGKHRDDGVPILRVNNFENGALDLSSMLKIDPSIEQKHLRTRLTGGEVLLTLVGSTGQSVIVDESMAGWNVARAIAVIRPSEEVGPKWINICLRSHLTRVFLDSRANTTVQKTLNLTDVRQIPILIPPRKMKTFVESCISTLDDKIELNRRMNVTLESMARALFKSWFVDFDPVIDNALAAGNPIPEPLIQRAQTRRDLGTKRKPLPKNIQKLFPDAFVFDDEMGWIPKGWKGVSITEMVESISDTYPLKTVDEVVFLNTGDVLDGNFLHDERSSTEGLPGQAKKSIQLGDILFSEIRPKNKRHAFVDFNASEYVVSTKLMVLRSFGKIESLFTYFLLKQDSTTRYLQMLAESRSGTFPQITYTQLESVRFTLPTENGIVDYFFSEVLSPNFKRCRQRERESETLAKLRDTLLPKLLSGELRIPDAEKLVAGSL